MEILNIEVNDPVIENIIFDIISPDGFSIYRDNFFNSKEEAEIAFLKWVENYKAQGYYSSVKYGKILLCDLEYYCKLVELK